MDGSSATSPTASLRGLAVWAAAWAAMLGLDGRLDLANLALLLVLASALAALWLPPALSALACLVSVLGFNWTFVPPRHTFSVDLHQHALLLAAMLGVGGIVALLVGRQRAATRLARQQAQRTRERLDLSDRLRASAHPMDAGAALRDALAALAGRPATVLLLPVPPGPQDEHPQARLLGECGKDQQVGLWQCLRQGVAFGPGTGRYQGEPAWYLPLRGRERAWGAALLPRDDGGLAPPLDDALRNQAQALCDLMGQALEQAHAGHEAAAARQQAQAEALRNTLLAAVAHDFRTPLATILGAASSLQDQDTRLSPPQRQRLAASVVDEARQLARLADNTLQLARLEGPDLALATDWESIEEIAGTVMRRLRRRPDTQRVHLRLEPGLPLLRCDAVLMVQLLDNLLDNALKYSGADAPVELLVRREGGALLLAVRDRGPGVPPAERERIFERYRRGDQAGAGRGAGVGLALARAIARAHGSELTLRPRGHGGSAFELRLPVQPSTLIQELPA